MTLRNTSSAPLLNLSEASAYLRVSSSTIRRMVKGGVLAAKKVGGQIRFSQFDIESAMLLHSKQIVTRPLEAELHAEPSWARTKISSWRERLTDLLQQAEPAKIIVNDRRGAKMFTILRPGHHVWGENLWHSSAIRYLDDDAIKTLFAGHRAVLFDEMVQNGRQIHDLRVHLESLGIATSTICLLRRRSYFLSGKLLDPNIVALEDLDDLEFRSTAAFLSRLLARRLSPLNVEHLMVSGFTTDKTLDASEATAKLESFGHCDVIWKGSPIEENGIDAWTLDRPQFFDTSALHLPMGMQIDFDGPVKLRFYHDKTSAKVTATFFAYPKITGSEQSWRRLILDTCKKFGMTVDEIFVHTAPSNDPLFERLSNTAYRAVCFDISLEMFRQALETGIFSALGIEGLATAPLNELTATFGKERAEQINEAVTQILRAGNSGKLFRIPFRPLSLNVTERPLVEISEPLLECREMLASVIPVHDSSLNRKLALTYSDLMRICAPVMERSISTALDHEIDIGTIHSTEKLEIHDRQISISRVYLRGEHNQDLPAFDDELVSRTRAVCVAAFAQWLSLRKRNNEGEILTTKLFANLRQDWADLPPIAVDWFPYKFGAVASFCPPADRPLVNTLVKHKCLSVENDGSRRRYKPDARFNLKGAYSSPVCPATLRSRVRSLIKAYAAIQELKVVRESAPRSGMLAQFAEPLTVLASARNEEVAYRCSRFEVFYWMKVGTEQLFPALLEAASLDSISEPIRHSLIEDLQEFAQAGRFLFEKIGMYKYLPEFRKQLEDLFALKDLEAGEIILETVDKQPRFSLDLSETLFPMGRIEQSVKMIRSFSGYCRQILTLANIDEDKRTPAEKTMMIDGVEVQRDHALYLRELVEATPAIKGLMPILSAIGPRTAKDGRLIPSDAKTLFRTFNDLSKILKEYLPDEKSAEMDRIAQDRKRRDFISVASNIHTISPGGYVVVADIYNFTNAVTGLAAYVGDDSTQIAQKIQITIQQHIEELGAIKPEVRGWVVSDTIIIFSTSLIKGIEMATELGSRLSIPLSKIDKTVGPQSLDALRVGVEAFGDTPGGLPVFEAIVSAYRIGDKHGKPRGYLAISQRCHTNLPDPLRDQFLQEGEVYVWTPPAGN